MKKLTKEQFVEKSKKVHNNKYNYSISNYVNSRTKIEIYCNKCKTTFKMYPTSHYFAKQGCPNCSVENQQSNNKKENIIAKSNFITKSKLIHGDKYDYSNTVYISTKKKVEIKCNTCKRVFFQYPNDHLKGCGCSCCTTSKGENKIKKILKEKNLTFETQKKYNSLKDKLPLSYDFYIPSKNLLIEYNGIQHYEYIPYLQKNYKNFLLQKHHDWLKRKYAKNNKINLLVISYKENIEKILEENL